MYLSQKVILLGKLGFLQVFSSMKMWKIKCLMPCVQVTNHYCLNCVVEDVEGGVERTVQLIQLHLDTFFLLFQLTDQRITLKFEQTAPCLMLHLFSPLFFLQFFFFLFSNFFFHLWFTYICQCNINQKCKQKMVNIR